MSEQQASSKVSEEAHYRCRVCTKQWSDADWPRPFNKPNEPSRWIKDDCIHCCRPAVEIARRCTQCEAYNGLSQLDNGVCFRCRRDNQYADNPPPTAAERLIGSARKLAMRGHSNEHIALLLKESNSEFKTLTDELLSTIKSGRTDAVINNLRDIESIIHPSRPDRNEGRGYVALPQTIHLPALIFLIERIEKLQDT